MPAAEIELVSEVLRRTATGELDAALELVSEDCYVRPGPDRILTRRHGFATWILGATAGAHARRLALLEPRAMAGGYVLARGLARGTATSLDLDAPGAWLLLVRAQRLSAVVWFASATEAAEAVRIAPRSGSPVEVVASVIDAFNRGDFVELLGLMHPDVRFSALLTDGATETGVAAAARFLARTRADYNEYVNERRELTDLGDGRVMVEATIRAERGGRIARTRARYVGLVVDGMLVEISLVRPQR